MGQMILSEILEMGRRVRATTLAVLALAVLFAWPAAGVELYRSEKGSVNFDTTLSMGVGLRVASRDDTIFFKSNDPRAPGVGSLEPVFSNSDDGNLNYDQFDVYSANFKGTFELEGEYNIGNSILTDIGAFIRATAFYDIIGNCGHCTRRTPLASEARHTNSIIDGGVVGAQFLLLDAYADARFEVLDRFIDLRFGNQVLSWGESLFIQGGIAQTNGFDVARIRVPGAQLKEAFIPAPMIRLSGDIIDNLSFEGYYQFWWNRTFVDPVGSYFATSDLVGRAAVAQYAGNDAGSGCPPGLPPSPLTPAAPPPCVTFVTAYPQGPDQEPSNQGQGGLALHYWWDQIQTEFGAFYMRYHNKVPYVGAVTEWQGSQPGVGPLLANLGSPIGYFRDYADEIDMVGGSFATTLLNIAFQGEISYRPNDAVPIVAAGLSIDKSVAQQGDAFNTGFVREKRIQAQVSWVGNMSSSTRWGVGSVVDATKAQFIVFTGEIGVINYPDLDRQCINRTGFVELNNNFPTPPLLLLWNSPGPQPCTPYAGPGTSNDTFYDYATGQTIVLPKPTVDATSWGLNTLLSFNYENPLGVPITLTPSVGWAWDFAGTSPNLTFIDGRQAVTVGLALDYLQVWGFQATYANFYGGSNRNQNRDRDFFAMSVSYAF